MSLAATLAAPQRSSSKIVMISGWRAAAHWLSVPPRSARISPALPPGLNLTWPRPRPRAPRESSHRSSLSVPITTVLRMSSSHPPQDQGDVTQAWFACDRSPTTSASTPSADRFNHAATVPANRKSPALQRSSRLSTRQAVPSRRATLKRSGAAIGRQQRAIAAAHINLLRSGSFCGGITLGNPISSVGDRCPPAGDEAIPGELSASTGHSFGVASSGRGWRMVTTRRGTPSLRGSTAHSLALTPRRRATLQLCGPDNRGGQDDEAKEARNTIHPRCVSRVDGGSVGFRPTE